MEVKHRPIALKKALELSAELSELIRSAWDFPPAFEQSRAQVAQGLSALSVGHGSAVQALLPALPASALALIRSQYESLVRSVWAAHSANDLELSLLLAPLDVESQQAARKLPSVIKMLAALEKSGPRGSSALLGRVRLRLGDELNSFVHGGIHPFARQRVGYPIPLLLDVLKNSNALSILTLLVLATLTNDEAVPAFLSELHHSFQDVLPTLEPLDS